MNANKIDPIGFASLYYNDDMATTKSRLKEYYGSDEVSIDIAYSAWAEIQQDLEEFYSE